MKRMRKALMADESGAVAAYVAVAIVVLVGCAALSLDVAHLVSVKRELTKAAEAGALSGARGLWPMMLPAVFGSRTPNCTAAQTCALAAATKNKADGANLATSEVTVEVGHWDYATKIFTPGTGANANGVRVTTFRANVPMIFAGVWGIFFEDLQASAIAVMDFAGAVGKGTLPIALNKDYTDPGTVLFINFSPDPTDNGGWFTDPPDSANASTLRDYITNDSCPPLNIGDIINLNNGNDTSVLQLMHDMLHLHNFAWDTLLPVVNTDRFNQSEPITAFVPFRIFWVDDSGGTKGVWGTVISLAEMATALPGGGTNYGALAPPKLVQ
jgi:Flp pilus assembly protein TadG